MNLPNKLSILRICLVPFIMFFYLAPFIPYGKIIAIALFIVAAVTDLFDGKIARKNGLVTDLGKLLDPIADKMLITCSLFLIVFDLTIAHPWGIIALTVLFTRDCIVNGVRQIAATKGVAVAAEKSGKIKAILAYIYIPFFMFIAQLNISIVDFAAYDTVITIFYVIGYILLAAATIVTAWSAIDYPLKNKDLILPKKEAIATVEEKSIETQDKDVENQELDEPDKENQETKNSNSEETKENEV